MNEKKSVPALRKDRSESDGEVWENLGQYLVREEAAYRVFIDDDFDIDWRATDGYRNNASFDARAENEIFVGAARLQAKPHGRFHTEMRMQYLRLIGEALVCMFECDYAAARTALAEAEQFFDARSEELSRYWYLTASFAATALCVAGGSAMWIWRMPVEAFVGSTVFWIVLAGIAGSAGALLSIISRSGTLKIESSVGKELHYFEGSLRVVAGVIGGMLAGLAVHSELLFGSLTRGENKQAVLILTAVAAGAGERFVGAIISRFDSEGGVSHAGIPGSPPDAADQSRKPPNP